MPQWPKDSGFCLRFCLVWPNLAHCPQPHHYNLCLVTRSLSHTPHTYATPDVKEWSWSKLVVSTRASFHHQRIWAKECLFIPEELKVLGFHWVTVYNGQTVCFKVGFNKMENVRKFDTQLEKMKKTIGLFFVRIYVKLYIKPSVSNEIYSLQSLATLLDISL